MPDLLAFVQFPHPGSEHQPKGALMDWNRRLHARKFLIAQGDYVREGSKYRGSFTFWGEWEPQSRVTKLASASSPDDPHWIHEPVWQVPRHRQLLQNTDPLVFGDSFTYSNCRQVAVPPLTRLGPGSLIVFGSKRLVGWVVDTVFVVGDQSRRFDGSTASTIEAPDWMKSVLFDPLQESEKKHGHTFRVYAGRTFDEAGEEPFSFVPCRPFAGRPLPFRRPVLQLHPSRFTPNLAQGAKVTAATRSQIRRIWDDIVDQSVIKPGLAMGVKLDPPTPLET